MADDTSPLHILGFKAENFMRLSAVEIAPKEGVVVITGKNGQGKSSILKGIYAALDAAGADIEKPIRDGQTEAVVQLSLGKDSVEHLLVTRTFTAASGPTGYLKITSPDGMKSTSQTLMRKFLGALTFDPIEFMTKPAKDQAAMLRGMVKIEVDIDQLDKDRQTTYDARTLHNANATRARARAEAVTLPPDMPEVAPDTTALLERLSAAAEVEAERNSLKRAEEIASDGRIEAERLCEEYAGRVSKLEMDLAKAREDLESAEGQLIDARKHEEAASQAVYPDPVDTAAIRAQISHADTLRDAFARLDRKIEDESEAETENQQALAMTAKMNAIDQKKATALAEAKMPVDGLGFSNGIVTFQGIPLSQASQAEQIRVSAAVAIASNPRVRVMCIREGSLLDSDSLALLAKIARDSDVQIWMERVQVAGVEPEGIIIEDGHVQGVEQAAKPEPSTAPAEPGPKDETPPATAVAAEEEMKTREAAAREWLRDPQTTMLHMTKDVTEASKLNIEVKRRLAKLPTLMATVWTPVYLAHIKKLSEKN